MPFPISNIEPGGFVPRSSAGMSPRSQTDFASGRSAPAPCSNTQAATLSAIRTTVTIGKRWVSFSSW